MKQRTKIRDLGIFDVLELVDCKMFSRKLVKLKVIHEAFPTAWGPKERYQRFNVTI